MSTATLDTTLPEESSDAPVLLAVSYLRVSTREQAERGGTEEGFSIPAQREANARKADDLGARIVREFIDAGESARSADRDGLQDMLAFIAATRVTFCIVHKLDRLARNRADDVKIHEALIGAGVTLVSATESIDQTPSGMLVHGIMSSIAEFYSRNLATEVTKGLTQKVAQGGTPMRAPIGYLNVRRTDDQGREIRTVEVDPERAPLIRWAFEQYASGETSVTALLRDITARGLVSVPSPKRPSKPLGKNALYRVLTNPYYAGVIRYKGALHPGAHEPIVEPALFDQVQSLLKARNAHATRHVQHAHHLKGLLHCGNCGSRMLLDFATNPRGTTYAYFVCSGRASKRTTCTRRAVPVQVAERLVEDSYASITISEDDYRHLAAEVDAAFDERGAGRDQEFVDLTRNRVRLEAESDKLLAAHFADAIDLPTLKRHQDRIRAGLADIEHRLREHDEQHVGGRAFLHDSLRLLTDAHRAYAHSDGGNRRLANQAFYTRLEITDDGQLRPRLAEPFATIVTEAMSAAAGKEAKREHSPSSDVACSRKTLWVGAVDGLGDEAILRLAPGVAEDLVSHADLRPGHCDHCHHARSRKHVMLVQHTTTGEIRHVGSTCLKDFLGWKTRPVLIWEDEITEQLERLSFGGPDAWSMRDVMVLAFAVTKVMGWASKAMCEGREDLIPTSTWVRALLNRESKAREVQDEVRDVMADAQAQADAARELLLLQHTANATYGYLANLGALLRSDMVEAKHLALAVSSVAAYHHAVSTQAEREARQQAAEQRRELAQASQWLGEVGEKITIAGTITTKTFIAGDWNRSSSWLIVVQTAAGIAKTFTAARWADDVEVGDHVSLTGKVKSLDVYQEARQTLMTRCKLNAGAAAA